MEILAQTITPVKKDIETEFGVIDNTSFSGWSPYSYSASFRNGKWISKGLSKGAKYLIDVGASGIQYGQSIFEGCIATRIEKKTYFFRPDRYYQRLSTSCERLCIPPPNIDLYFRALNIVTEANEQWKKPFASNFLYLRPILFGSNGHIIPMSASQFEFVILATPYIRPFKASGQNLIVESHYGRTTVNGVGAAKTGANYAHSHYPNALLDKVAYDGILWTDAATHTYVEEANISNIFIETDEGVFTPELNGQVLPGITRQSVIDIISNETSEKIHVQRINIKKVFKQYEEGKIRSIFATGTAVGIQPVASITYQHKVMRLDVNTPLVKNLRDRLLGIQKGISSDDYQWMVSTDNLCR